MEISNVRVNDPSWVPALVLYAFMITQSVTHTIMIIPELYAIVPSLC